MKIKLKNIQIIAIAMLMATVVSCESELTKNDGYIYIGSPMQFSINDCVFESEGEYHYWYHLSGIRSELEVVDGEYEIKIHRGDFLSPMQPNLAAELLMCVKFNGATISTETLYPITKDIVCLGVDAISPYRHTIYRLDEGWIQFNNIVSYASSIFRGYSFSGDFNMVAKNQKDEEITENIVGTFEDVLVFGDFSEVEIEYNVTSD